MSRLGAYVSASTENPLGHRPHAFALKNPQSQNTVLDGYYPANYYVPTPLNIQMTPQPNIFYPGGGMSGLTDFLSPEVIGGILVIGALWYLMRSPRRGRRR